MKPTAFDQIDGILAEIGKSSKDLTTANTALEAEMNMIRNKYQTLMAPMKKRVADLEKALKSFCKKVKTSVFRDRERVDLPHGSVVYATANKVKQIKKALEKLKAAGLDHGIKVSESVDWAKIETWPDEWLKKIGTERVKKDEISYEVKK